MDVTEPNNFISNSYKSIGLGAMAHFWLWSSVRQPGSSVVRSTVRLGVPWTQGGPNPSQGVVLHSSLQDRCTAFAPRRETKRTEQNNGVPWVQGGP